jgi:hypothetical protein
MMILALCLILQAPLPPLTPQPWKDAFTYLDAQHPWATPFEQSKRTASPNESQTRAFLLRLAEATPWMTMVTIGHSVEGRPLEMVIVSTEGAFTSEALRQSSRPLLYVQAGIHAGEIDGKDALMLLLRNASQLQVDRDLFDKVNLAFLPMFNIDGHERSSTFGRINQRGPEVMGWRTNASNLNLNRDYAKIDSPEMAAMLRFIVQADPLLSVDVHVTDGMDYQYDITWGGQGAVALSPASEAWIAKTLTPLMLGTLEQYGHCGGPLIFGKESRDPSQGIVEWVSQPRFSTGYGDWAHLPTILMENHSLKPYDQRVNGTYLALTAMMRALHTHGAALKQARTQDQNQPLGELPLRFGLQTEPATIDFKGITYERYFSDLTRQWEIRFTGHPWEATLPVTRYTKIEATVAPIKTFLVPKRYPEILEKLDLHGIAFSEVTPGEEEWFTWISEQHEFSKEPLEGRFRVTASWRQERRNLPAGDSWVRVSTDQPKGRLAMHLLHPAFPDSFFQWGHFLDMFQRTEYVEGYVMEPYAQELLKDPSTAQAFQAFLTQRQKQPPTGQEILQWFYRRTPYFDQRYLVYPIRMEH